MRSRRPAPAARHAAVLRGERAVFVRAVSATQSSDYGRHLRRESRHERSSMCRSPRLSVTRFALPRGDAHGRRPCSRYSKIQTSCPCDRVRFAQHAWFVTERFTTATEAISAGDGGADVRAAVRGIGPVAAFEERRNMSGLDRCSSCMHLSKCIESLRYANFVWAMNEASSLVRIRSRTNDLLAASHRSRCLS